METIEGIPTNFRIANTLISVEIKDRDNVNNDYGCWCDAENKIYLYREVKCREEWIKLTEEQIKNTFYHELIHCFQFYFNNTYDEAQAQVFANFIREYECSSIY